MNDKEKIGIFQKHLNLIRDEKLRGFTEYCITKFPEYFWTLPASTSGRRHGGTETLVNHIQGCLYVAEDVCEQFRDVWKQENRDQLYSSLILHDGWRCENADGSVRFCSQEIINERGYSQDKLGNFLTSPEHPEAGFNNLKKLFYEYFKQIGDFTDYNNSFYWDIFSAVRLHYGTFTKGNFVKFDTSLPYHSLIIQVHNIDFHNAKNATFYNCCEDGK